MGIGAPCRFNESCEIIVEKDKVRNDVILIHHFRSNNEMLPRFTTTESEDIEACLFKITEKCIYIRSNVTNANHSDLYT